MVRGLVGSASDLVIAPIGFLSEHIEVIYDLDIEVGQICEDLGLNMIRAGVVGRHPRIVKMIRELIEERVDPGLPRATAGDHGPWPDECPADCCRP